MKIKLYIVTYNNPNDLNENLRSLFNSNWNGHNLEINIINNHSNFQLQIEYQDKVKVLHNVCRPNFSTGHLSRNWNQAIINGFQSLTNPDCDILIHYQDDSIFTYDWLSRLLDLHQQYTFVQNGIGDNFCSYTVDAIKTIGLWDERFCGLGYQEADYFLRSLIFNRNKTCLNDYQHGRLINNTEYNFCSRPKPSHIFSADHYKSMSFHYINEKIFQAKWNNVPPNYWTPEVYNNPPQNSAILNFIYYPYFEKDIIDLAAKNYII